MYLKQPTKITGHQWPDGMLPLVSITCKAYNHELFIRNAIEGFLIQTTTFPVEIVIHDDASSDRTPEIIREYEQRFPELFRTIYQTENQRAKKDGTIAKTLNRVGRGKYIAICDGDDYWTDPLKLQKQVDFMENHPDYSLCSGAYRIENLITGKNSEVINVRLRGEKGNYSFSLTDTLEKWLTKVLTVLYRNEFVDVDDLLRYNFKRDIHLFYHLLKKGKGYYFDECFGVYRIHQSGIFSTMTEYERLKIHFDIYKELYVVNGDDFSRIKYFNAAGKLFSFRCRNRMFFSEFINNMSLLFLLLRLSKEGKDYSRLLKGFLKL